MKTNQTVKFYLASKSFSVVTPGGKRLNYIIGDRLTPAAYTKLPTRNAQANFTAVTNADLDLGAKYTEAELDLIVGLYITNYTKSGWATPMAEVTAEFNKFYPRRSPASVQLYFAACQGVDNYYQGKGAIGGRKDLRTRLVAIDANRFVLAGR